MLHKTALFAGPLLFLLAQALMPGGSADAATRQALIAAEPDRWALGHQVFVVAMAFALWWLLQLWASVQARAPRAAALGVFFAGFALLADFGIAALQLLALEAVRALPAEQALAVLKLMGSPNLLTFVFLPYLGFALGFGMLALAWWHAAGDGHGSAAESGRGSAGQAGAGRRWLAVALLAATGVLITAGGLAGSQPAFIAAGITWLAFTVLWLQRRRGDALEAATAAPRFGAV